MARVRGCNVGWSGESVTSCSHLRVAARTMTRHAEKPKRSKLQLEVLALAALNHRAVSVTVRRLSPPDRNWNWELASIQPVPSGHGQAQARESILPLQFTFDLEN